MINIVKITSDTVVDFAAEELKKYLRMMMPECGDVKISYDPKAPRGFRLGLMQDLGLDVSDAEDVDLDDILYIDCEAEGGVIAGDNPRSVLLAVYEYLRQNGCRWLYPGVDGEYIPMQDVQPVKLRHKPSCRYRGQCNEGAEYQQAMLDTIDFTPKLGMNVYMLEFKIPTHYYDLYYSHSYNTENRNPEPLSKAQILQWKRQCETEIAKRGLQFHDIGHGWTSDAFGIESEGGWESVDESAVPPEMLQYISMLDGKRCLYLNQPINTNFCMSNPDARAIVAKYVADYASNHSNSTYIHVWLADGRNNHCECPECQKKRPSDWYIILMNEIDEELTKRQLDTRIVFIQYNDTTWAPQSEKIKNPNRFTMLVAPITRSYEISLPNGEITATPSEYVRNASEPPKLLEEYMAHYKEWRKTWKGASVSYEYHFWINQAYDVSGLHIARIINEDVKSYKSLGINGIIEDGSQRSFFPTGLAFYSYARSLYDASLKADEIIEDYFSHVFGDDWKEFYDYLKKLSEAMPFSILTLGRYGERHNSLIDDQKARLFSAVKDIVKEGQDLIKSHYNSDVRVQTVTMRLLEKHAEYCEGLAEVLVERAKGNVKVAKELFDEFRIKFGRHESEIERYFDHALYFSTMEKLIDEPQTDMRFFT